jgi:hypothetical protein
MIVPAWRRRKVASMVESLVVAAVKVALMVSMRGRGDE